MKKKLKKIYIFLFLLLLTSYNPQENPINKDSIFLPIKYIIIENNKVVENKLLLKNLSYLYGKNLVLLKKKNVKKTLENFDFISSTKFKKIYPNTLKIIVVEKIPIAVYILEKKKFYISEKGDLINYIEFEDFKNLPTVFGKYLTFKTLYTKLLKLKFKIQQVKSYYYFESGRWDIELKNGKIIKLPISHNEKSIINFMRIKNEINYGKHMIFDYRINNQLILN
jgi:cell division protein FtsQ|tara:strand:+ start:348 stop:1019 length:672 start_codon:yes stop_codon:yes gene_type:complete